MKRNWRRKNEFLQQWMEKMIARAMLKFNLKRYLRSKNVKFYSTLLFIRKCGKFNLMSTGVLNFLALRNSTTLKAGLTLKWKKRKKIRKRNKKIKKKNKKNKKKTKKKTKKKEKKGEEEIEAKTKKQWMSLSTKKKKFFCTFTEKNIFHSVLEL